MAASKHDLGTRLEYKWVILATGFVVLFFNSGSRFAFGLMLKPMADDLEWSRTTLSMAVATYMLVSAAAMPVVGRIVDSLGPRWILAVAVVLGAAGLGFTGAVETRWQLFVLYGLVYALGQAGSSTAPVGVMISRWFPRRLGAAASSAISGNSIGQLVIVALLASALTSLGWRASFAILAAVNVVIVVPLVIFTVRPNPAESESGAEGQSGEGGTAPDHLPAPLGRILGSRQLWMLVVIFAVCGFQDFFMVTHVVAFARDQGVGAVLAGNMLAVMGLMGLVGVLASGVLADAYGAARPTILCFLVRIGAFALVLYSQDTASIVVFALAYGFTFSITAPLTVVFVNNIYGRRHLGTLSGLINMVHQVAGGLGALVGAVIFDYRGSYDGAFVVMLALALLATATTFQLSEKRLAGAPVTA